jgi:hypothetical protein
MAKKKSGWGAKVIEVLPDEFHGSLTTPIELQAKLSKPSKTHPP